MCNCQGVTVVQGQNFVSPPVYVDSVVRSTPVVSTTCFETVPARFYNEPYVYDNIRVKTVPVVASALAPFRYSFFERVKTQWPNQRSIQIHAVFSNPEYFIITSAYFEWNVDFDKKRVYGYVDLNFKNNTESISTINNHEIILDTRDLIIHQVQDLNENTSLEFSFGESHHAYGKSLKIALKKPPNDGNLKLRIKYETSPSSTALQWLEPNQTLGKKHPYLFSLSEAIHARSLFPCQDTPTVKLSYTAKINVQNGFVAVMSALRKDKLDNGNGLVQYEFYQPIAVPSYLIAFVVGDLVSKKIGPRSYVWTERENIEEAAYEFGEIEEMIKTAEDLLCEYIWGISDLLVLPPTFPYGGMENPCLIYVTPTLLAGDRSLADVLIHEICHSWTGNLITNRNWEHFWLNEGFTMFIERKLIGILHGEKYRQFDCIEGWRRLLESVEQFGESHEFTKLIPNLSNQHPEDAFSCVPYEKGHALLYYLEEKLGGPAIFNKYLKAHIEYFKLKSFDTDDWKTFLYNYFQDKKQILDSVDWETWLYKSGMPPVTFNFDTTLTEQCTKLCETLLSSNIQSIDPVIKEFSGLQIQELLSQILEKDPLSQTKMDELNKYYDIYFSKTKNCEILFRWIRIGIKAQWKPIIEQALNFVASQGRMKFIRPVYRDLFKWNESRQLAIDRFSHERKYMHQTSASLVEKDLSIIQ